MVKTRGRERFYAKESGLTVDEWKALDAESRKEKRDAVDARVKAEKAKQRSKERQRAETEKLKRDAARQAHKKMTNKAPSQWLPGATRRSTITGLMDSPTDRKWNPFLYEGPYWNYLVRFISKKNIFGGRQDRVEEAVQNACAKIGKFMVSKRYKYTEIGKGYFRGFIKVVALRAAIDLFKEIRRQEQIVGDGSQSDERTEFDKIQDDMVKAHANRDKKLAKKKIAGGVSSEIESTSEHDLDVYDASAGFDRNIAPSENVGSGKKMHSIARLDANPFMDDDVPSNYDSAAMFDYLNKVSKADLSWVQKLQIHIVYIALGYVLSNDKISAEKREMLRLRYGLDMKVADIYALPRFASKDRRAFDTQMSRATDDLRKEVKTWWDIVAPSKNDFADETVLRFWRDLSNSDDRARIANDLQDKAIQRAGRIK